MAHWKRPWCWERLKAGGEGDDRGWDGWVASPTQWTWVWVNSGSWWWTGRPGVLQSIGSQRERHDWATELKRHGIKIIRQTKNGRKITYIYIYIFRLYKKSYHSVTRKQLVEYGQKIWRYTSPKKIYKMVKMHTERCCISLSDKKCY